MIIYIFFLTKKYTQKHWDYKQGRGVHAVDRDCIVLFIFSQHFQPQPLPRPPCLPKIPLILGNKTTERRTLMHTLFPHALNSCKGRNQETGTRIQI